MTEIIEYLEKEGPTRVLKAIKDLDLNNQENMDELQYLLKEEDVLCSQGGGDAMWYYLPGQNIPPEKKVDVKEKVVVDGPRCVDCGASLVKKTSKRCSSCAAKQRVKVGAAFGGHPKEDKNEPGESAVELEKQKRKWRRDAIVIHEQMETINALKKEAGDELDSRLQLQATCNEQMKLLRRLSRKVAFMERAVIAVMREAEK